jgi:hypothetical protein
MAYLSKWELLSAARERVMTVTGLSKEQVETDLCRAIADRVVSIRGKLKEHLSSPMRSSVVLEGKDLDIPATIGSTDLDWEQSRPVKPWVVRRGAFQPGGHWHLERIEVSTTDVTDSVCATEQPSPAPEHARRAAGATLVPDAIRHGPRSHAPQSSGAPGGARRRGVRPIRFEQASGAMRDDIQQGRRTVVELKNMLEKNLAETYGVSRDTARKARNAVLSEFGED